jgi:hypothetical protein
VLLVDEVLSVGDAAFQDRSMRRMLEFRDRKQAAIVFVSHNLGALEMMCPRAIWLERGVTRAAGDTLDVLRAYLDAVDSLAEDSDAGHLSVSSVDVMDASSGERTQRVTSGQPFTVRIRGSALRELPDPVFVVTVRGDHGPLFAGNMHIDGNWPVALPQGPFEVDCTFCGADLSAGRYRVELKVKQNVRTNFFEPRVMATFAVGEAHSGGTGDVAYRMIGDAA